MIKNIILVLVLSFTSTQIANAQIFDQAKYDERVANIESSSGVSKKAYLSFLSIQNQMEKDRIDEALKIALEVDTKKFNPTELVTYYQILAGIHLNIGNLEATRELYERILESPSINMILYKQLLINVSQLYLSGDNPDKALEFLDLYFTYEHSPSWSVYMIAVRGFLIKKDYETAIKYVDLSEQAHIRLTQNYNERQLTRFKDRIENTNKQITATREMLQRGLAGEDISWTEEKSASENEKKENADHDFQILHFSNPVFPKKAIKEKIEGWVQLKFDIDNSGKAINIEVANSSNKIFEEPALAALFEYRFNVLRNQNEDGFLIGTTLRIEFAFAKN